MPARGAQTDEPHIEEKVDVMVRRETVEAGMPAGALTQPGPKQPDAGKQPPGKK